MKKYFSFTTIILLFAFSILLTNCKKKDSTSTTDLTATVDTQSKDASALKVETDQSDADVNNAVAANSSLSGNRAGLAGALIGISVDSSQANSAKIIKLNFLPGTIFNNYRKRSGKITVTLIQGNRWSDAGSVLQYTYDSFKVYNTATGKSILFNGTRTITNVNGGNAYTITLANNPNTIVHKVRNLGLNVTFIDSNGTTKTATWNIARRTSINYTNGVYTVTTSGDTTLNGVSKVESWGTNRYGDAFVTVFSTDLTSNSSCGYWKPTAGVVVHTVANFTFTITYGVDALGTVVSSGCPNFYKYTWTRYNGTQGVAVIPYY